MFRNSLTLIFNGWGLSAFVQESNNKPRDRSNRIKTGNWKLELKFGTWNIRTLYEAGAMRELVEELESYKMFGITRSEIGGRGHNKEVTNNNYFKWKKRKRSQTWNWFHNTRFNHTPDKRVH